MREFQRITIDPDVMGGKPCIRGMRVTAGMIVESLAEAARSASRVDGYSDRLETGGASG